MGFRYPLLIMAIRKIKKNSIGAQVYEQMQQQLIRGAWRPGDRLPSENDLAEQMGVSRISIRQAIQRLTALGLLESRVGEGTYVQRYTPGMWMNGLVPAAFLGGSSLLEVLEFRRIIEVPTAELAARKATDSDIEALERIYLQMQEAISAPGRFFQADLAFHKELVCITGNTLAIETYTILQHVLESTMAHIVELRGYTQGIYFHGRLLEAMRARDAVLCRQVMEAHIDDTFDAVQQSAEPYMSPKSENLEEEKPDEES